ncbi:hypothetical protein EVAR_103327_1 [Eumeta japonica]|uniref:Uncharacterized protein n=1 Tax=Eumeta variegata TaxID=151549 RepID=A0A4C1Z4B2_EUMVA|nr:hypothetical protein EVAR_103327_1 [Eumeta japonica]
MHAACSCIKTCGGGGLGVCSVNVAARAGDDLRGMLVHDGSKQWSSRIILQEYITKIRMSDGDVSLIRDEELLRRMVRPSHTAEPLIEPHSIRNTSQ